MNEVFHEQGEGAGQGFNPVPSLFTLCNALCGFTAILLTIGPRPVGVVVPVLALWLVFGAMLFDVLDGLAAQVLDARSLHGMHLDSLADAVSFGVAPAVLIHAVGMAAVEAHSLPALSVRLLSGIYLGCALWRLAVYNTRAVLGVDKESKAVFVGLPSPAAAAMVCCMAFFHARLLPGETVHFAMFVVYSLIASLLMVSSVPYPHLRNVMAGMPTWLAVAVVAGALGLVWFYRFPGVVLLAHLYILLPPASEVAGRLLHRAGLGDEPRL